MAAHTVNAHGNFLVPNATFIAEFIAFLLILFILARYVYPVIRKPIEARQALIAQADRGRRGGHQAIRRGRGRVSACPDRGPGSGRSDSGERSRPRRRASLRNCARPRRRNRLASSPAARSS